MLENVYFVVGISYEGEPSKWVMKFTDCTLRELHAILTDGQYKWNLICYDHWATPSDPESGGYYVLHIAIPNERSARYYQKLIGVI